MTMYVTHRMCACRPCSHCNDCRELDLCRDESLQKGNWDCPNCGAAYDKAPIEARLVAALQARLKEYTLQDLSCTKCKQVRPSGGGGGGDGAAAACCMCVSSPRLQPACL